MSLHRGFVNKFPAVVVEIRFPPKLESKAKELGFLIPDPIRGYAIIDTTASQTAVRRGVLEKWGIGEIPMCGIESMPDGDVVGVKNLRIILGSLAEGDLGFSFTGAILETDLSAEYVCRIGMDILKFAFFQMSGPRGVWELRFDSMPVLGESEGPRKA